MIDVRGKMILVVGLGRSGCAVADLLRRHGAHTVGLDDADAALVHAGWTANDLSELAGAAFDEIHCGGDWLAALGHAPDAVALSPGVPGDHPRLRALRAAGVPVHGELEWASRFFTGRTVAVTGTNGKSTTTAWIAHLLRVAGRRSDALGNLGRPFAREADRLPADAIPVLECSSFQLETIDRFRPHVGVVLNLAPDHLDRYPDLANYYAAKRRLAEHVAEAGTFVTWTGCDEARRWITPGRRALFGDAAPDALAWLGSDRIWVRHAGEAVPLFALADLPLPSPPNRLNAAAAVAAALPLVDDLDALREGLRTFGGLAHRHQPVGRLGGVRFVDDTKATNVHAVCAGLRGYPGDVVLIAGGRGKGEDYAPLRETMDSVRHVVVIGEDGPAIAAVLQGCVPTSSAADMPAAVRLALAKAEPDATVLLSPACASFDMFRDYRERGEAFAAAARDLGATLQED